MTEKHFRQGALEGWQQVVGYEGIYEVSTLGRVRRVAKGRGARAGWILRQSVRPSHGGPDGYLKVSLLKRGVQTSHAVHSMMCRAFLGPYPKGCYVNHKDGVKQHNNLGNLEYQTPSYNNFHAFALGLRPRKWSGFVPPPMRGTANPRCKLSEKDVLAIRASDDLGSTLARCFKVSQSLISSIRTRKNWAWLT